MGKKKPIVPAEPEKKKKKTPTGQKARGVLAKINPEALEVKIEGKRRKERLLLDDISINKQEEGLIETAGDEVNPVPKWAEDSLSREQILFCQLYTTREFFGNGTQSYIEAYNINTMDPGAYIGAVTSASRLLTKAYIMQYINYLLEDVLGVNDAFVDKQLVFLITQNADLRAKMAAIKEYNILKNRVERNKGKLKEDGDKGKEHIKIIKLIEVKQ